MSAIFLREENATFSFFETRSKVLRLRGKSEHNVTNVEMQMCALGMKSF